MPNIAPQRRPWALENKKDAELFAHSRDFGGFPGSSQLPTTARKIRDGPSLPNRRPLSSLALRPLREHPPHSGFQPRPVSQGPNTKHGTGYPCGKEGR